MDGDGGKERALLGDVKVTFPGGDFPAGNDWWGDSFIDNEVTCSVFS